MSQEFLDQLRENGQLASQTAQIVARLLDSSSLTEEHKARMRPAIEAKQLELALLMDRLGILERTEEIDEMLRGATNIKRLWEDISSKLDFPTNASDA